MKKYLGSFLAICFLFATTITVNADVVFLPFIPSSEDFPIFLLVVGLIIALIVGIIILIKILNKPK